jgi:hypothetical protein
MLSTIQTFINNNVYEWKGVLHFRAHRKSKHALCIYKLNYHLQHKSLLLPTLMTSRHQTAYSQSCILSDILNNIS